jgi:hypothetical protein
MIIKTNKLSYFKNLQLIYSMVQTKLIRSRVLIIRSSMKLRGKQYTDFETT